MIAIDCRLMNMLPPEEVLPGGAIESKCLLDELADRFAKDTGETIVFDSPRRLIKDGQCILKQQPHPLCQAMSCTGRKCLQQWRKQMYLACTLHSVAQWQCPEKNTVFLDCLTIDGNLLYVSKVVLHQHSVPKNIALVRNIMSGLLREMALSIQNSVLKQQLETKTVHNDNAPGPTAKKTAHPAVTHALKYIDEHYHNTTLSLTGVSEAVGISPSYLSGLFHKRTGSTFHDHVKKLRLGKAQELMESTRLSISEIAWRSGFSTPRNLRRALQGSESSKNSKS